MYTRPMTCFPCARSTCTDGAISPILGHRSRSSLDHLETTRLLSLNTRHDFVLDHQMHRFRARTEARPFVYAWPHRAGPLGAFFCHPRQLCCLQDYEERLARAKEERLKAKEERSLKSSKVGLGSRALAGPADPASCAGRPLLLGAGCRLQGRDPRVRADRVQGAVFQAGGARRQARQAQGKEQGGVAPVVSVARLVENPPFHLSTGAAAA